MEAIRREGGLTPEDIRRRIDEVRKRRTERQMAEAKGADGRTGDSVVDAMRGVPSAAEARELAAMSDDEKLRMQVQVMLEQQQKDSTRKARHQQSEDEEESKQSPRERRKGKVPVFFTSPR